MFKLYKFIKVVRVNRYNYNIAKIKKKSPNPFLYMRFFPVTKLILSETTLSHGLQHFQYILYSFAIFIYINFMVTRWRKKNLKGRNEKMKKVLYFLSIGKTFSFLIAKWIFNCFIYHFFFCLFSQLFIKGLGILFLMILDFLYIINESVYSCYCNFEGIYFLTFQSLTDQKHWFRLGVD